MRIFDRLAHSPWLAHGLFFYAALPFVLALISQYGFGLKPCELCLWQRVPYILLMLLAVLFSLIVRHPRFLLAMVAVWLAGAALAFYHLGVEQSWWISASGCSPSGGGDSLDEIHSSILSAPLVACNQPAFRFLSLSMAGWNLVFSLASAILFFALYSHIPKDSKHDGTSAGKE